MTHRIMQANCNVIVKDMVYKNELGNTLSDIFLIVNKYYHK
jgi:hypothetical protein